MVSKSDAVVATSPSKAYALLNEGQAFTTFYKLVASGVRQPLPNWFDKVRGVADELLFPNYRDEISFGALSADGRGCGYYGSVFLVLAEFAVRQRVTVFEENSLLFCRKRGLGVDTPVPPGFRAIWDERDLLAAAKLEPLLATDTAPGQFPALLLSPEKSADCAFVEVHIYGTIDRHSVARVYSSREPQSEDDEVLKSLISRACVRHGIPVGEAP